MRLTRGEGWWLLRRRGGESQVDTARSLGISEDRYRRWERDRAPAPMPVGAGQPRDPLTWAEWCALQRRRRGWSLPEAARRMRISRQTLWKAEWGRTRGIEGVRRFYERIGPRRPTTAAPVSVPGPGPGVY